MREDMKTKLKSMVKKYLRAKGYSKDSEHYLFELNYFMATISKAEDILKLIDYFKKINFKGKKVLEAGCGMGGIAIAAAKRGAHVTAVDLDEGKLEIAKSLAKHNKVKIKFLKKDLTARIFDNSAFDIIISINTLEHISPDLMLKHLYSYLKPGGIIILKTPNKYFPFETHIKTFLLHYLPVKFVDYYLKHRYKSFFYDYESFSDIKLLSYRFLKEILKKLKTDCDYKIYPVFSPIFPITDSTIDYKWLKTISRINKVILLKEILTNPKLNSIAQSWVIAIRKNEATN